MAPGTYVCVRTHGFVAWCIRVMTLSRYNHAYIVISDTEIVEAQPSGACVSPITKYAHAITVDNSEEPLTYMQRLAICKYALGLVGTPYNFLDIISVGLLQFGIKSKAIRDRVQDVNQLICSQLVDKAYLLAEVHLFDDGRLPQDVTPGDLADRVARRTWA